MNHRVRQISINKSARILDALKLMDETEKRLLLVFEEEKFAGLLSIGDIQRAIIRNVPLTENISQILRKTIRVARSDQDISEIRDQMLLHRIECMPVLDAENNLVKALFWEDEFGSRMQQDKAGLDIPVVIMAGGKGTRLKPLTNIIPKALLPVGEKTILEKIMDQFRQYGCKEFHISINHKGDMIRDHMKKAFPSIKNLHFFRENKPLGTAGSLYLLKNKINKTFFVSNCDILVYQDLHDIYNYHRETGNLITIVGALKHYRIPYGTLKTAEDGKLEALSEKPEITYMINSGFYLLEPEVLNSIKDETFMNITSLIEDIKNENGRCGVFPVTEKSWKDIGNWEEYISVIGR